MDWLEQNLDAYRIIAEILKELREMLRASLEKKNGKEWYKACLPEGLLDHLVEIKEKEKAIDWYESEYQEIMSYAVFPDLLNILEANTDAFPAIMDLAPTGSLLHARFLELEVMRSKLGRARPISDTELAFLGTFHLRFRRAIDDFRSPASEQQPPSDTAAPAKKPSPAVAAETTPPPHEEAPPVDEPVTADAQAGTTPAAEEATPAKAQESESDTEPERPPQRKPQPAVDQASAEAADAAQTQPPDSDPAAADDAATSVADARPKDEPESSFEDALENGDDRTILRALYQEVTNTAEGIWTKEVLPTIKVWEMVRISTWYEESFSRLGLKPVSDFYEIMSKVDSNMREGASKQDLQDQLKQSNFAQILLSLRDMFQSHAI